MGKRGPKSLAELTSPALETFSEQRVPPPDHLNERAKEEWMNIIHAMPRDWFHRENLSLLELHCASISEAVAIQGMIERVRPTAMEDDTSYKRYTSLLERLAGQKKLIATSSTKLRLTQQSRWTGKTAATAVRNGRTGDPSDKYFNDPFSQFEEKPKPWEK